MSANYLAFPTKSTADLAQARISANMGFPKPGYNGATGQVDPSAQVTERWDSPQYTSLLEWVFMEPPAQYMTGVIGFMEKVYSAAWFTITN